jgi:hypothetical protein
MLTFLDDINQFFFFLRKLRRHFSQKSLLLLSINLLFVNILFSIIGLDIVTHLSCIIIASLLHYFVLSSFSWMFIMALIQYLLFVKVFPRSISAFTRKAAVFAQCKHLKYRMKIVGFRLCIVYRKEKRGPVLRIYDREQ